MFNAFKKVVLGATTLTVMSSLLLTGCANSGGGNKVVATVDGTEIFKADFDESYKGYTKAFRLDSMPEDDNRVMLEKTLRNMVVNELIAKTLIKNEAKELGITVTDKEVQERKDNEIKNNPELEAQYEAFLDQNNLTEEEMNENLKEEMLIEKFADQKAGADTDVPAEIVKKFYNENPDQFKMPERIRARHILIKAVPAELKAELQTKDANLTGDALEKAVREEIQARKAEAQTLLSQVKKDISQFPALAKEHSDDPGSAAKGGELGPMSQEAIVPEFWAALKQTRPGQLHQNVVASPFGFHIIEVQEAQKAGTVSFEEAKGQIARVLKQQRQGAILKEWLEGKKASATIVIEDDYKAPAMNAEAPNGTATTQSASTQGKAPASSDKKQ